MEDSNIIKKQIKEKVFISRVFTAHYQKPGTITAELKQQVSAEIIYPDKIIRNNLQGNIFDTEDFEVTGKVFTSNRIDVTWITVPKNSTLESVKEQLAKFPNATLYRILSNHPIMSDSQKLYYDSLIESGQESLAFKFEETVANSQLLTYSQDSPEGMYYKGDLLLDINGKPQYKACFLDETGKKEDLDLKTKEPSDFYSTIEVKMKLSGLVNSQGQQL